jgi:hypothetical protein
MTLSRTLVIASLIAAAVPARAEMHGVTVAGRFSSPLSSDIGQGVRTDGGGGLSLRLRFGDEDHTRWELGLEGDAIGTVDTGDDDPIVQLAVMVGRRGDFGDSGSLRPFWFVGAGVGGSALGATGFLVPLRAGLGLALAPRRGFGLELSGYERVGIVRGGTPDWTVTEGLCVELGLGVGPGAPTPTPTK